MANSADSDRQLIWIYTVCKGGVYPGSAGQGLKQINAGSLAEWLVLSTYKRKVGGSNPACVENILRPLVHLAHTRHALR